MRHECRPLVQHRAWVPQKSSLRVAIAQNRLVLRRQQQLVVVLLYWGRQRMLYLSARSAPNHIPLQLPDCRRHIFEGKVRLAINVCPCALSLGRTCEVYNVRITNLSPKIMIPAAETLIK